jgi:hypothetical protein
MQWALPGLTLFRCRSLTPRWLSPRLLSVHTYAGRQLATQIEAQLHEAMPRRNLQWSVLHICSAS